MSPTPAVPPAGLVAAAGRALGETLTSWVDVSERGGLSDSSRFTAVTNAGTSVFVKSSGTNPGYFSTATEIRAYESLCHEPWMASMLGHDASDPSIGSVLVLEDLTDCVWPPPWSPEMIEQTRFTITAIAETPPPHWVPAIDQLDPEFVDGWPGVLGRATDAAVSGLCSPAWATAHLDALAADASNFERVGPSLCHLDLWSDNVCARDDGQIVVLDWTDVCRANALLMAGIWASDTAAQTGITPEELMPRAPGLATFLIGLGWNRLIDPPPWMSSGGERLLRRRLTALLPYAARLLGLPHPMADSSDGNM